MSSAKQIVLENGGRWSGHCGMMNCPAHDDHKPSLLVSDIEGRIRVHCFSGCDWRDVRKALGLDGAASVARSSTCVRDTRSGLQLASKSIGAIVQRTWAETRPIAGSIAEKYLWSRGIVPDHGMEYLRFHPNLRYDDTASFPALVAGITTWPSTTVHAIQRTYLTDGGRKIDRDPARKILGSVSGGAVRFGDVGRTLIVAEGVETVLSVQQAVGEAAWAALSASYLKNLRLPDLPLAKRVIIAADNDENRTGQAAAEQAALRWHEREIHIVHPTCPGDWNDVLLEGVTT
jgi:hypothetical protein